MVTWLNFKELREKLDFREVLRHYRVPFKEKGDQAHGYCPLPTHPRHEGKRRSPSFSVNLRRNIWQCFGCGARGNVIDFACRMEGLNPDIGQDIRTVALRLQEVFGLKETASPKSDRKVRSPPVMEDVVPPHRPIAIAPAQENAGQGATCPAIVNAPLDFELKGLDPSHPYLKERGFTPETIAFFGLGYCGKGLMQGRIAIPLHDPDGRLVGYAGRLIDDTAVAAGTPKYLFPGARTYRGTTSEFRKSLLLYNIHRLAAGVEDLVVVEGFTHAWWLWQQGYPNVVALMGASCSVEQAALIARWVSPHGHVWVMTDADAAGDRCATEVLTAISPLRFCRWAKLTQGQPTDLSAEALSSCLPALGEGRSF